MKHCLTLLLLALTLSSSVWAFDGSRKGLVLGGGAGFTPFVRWSVTNSYLGMYDTSETEIGLYGQVTAGYAWDEHNVLAYQGSIVIHKSDYFDTPTSGRPTVQDRLNAVVWYHYFGRVGRSLFSCAGLGLYTFHVSGLDVSKSRGGFLIGGGYEFAPHFQAGVYIAGGRTAGTDFDFKHSQLNLVVAGFMY